VKVRILTSFGTAERTYNGGEEADLDKDTAKQLIEAGIAEPVGKAPAKRAETRKK
jgi:hypothetical protein